MEKVTIYHNPNCGTSRNVLALLQACGLEVEVINYLETPPTEEKLKELLAQMEITARELLRTNVPPYETLGLSDELKEDAIISAMMTEPILINRPIVVTSKGVKLCRPSEAVLEILPVQMMEDFVKEDGEVISKPAY
ncbi:arsenate reductase (glutaredoxin) [Streptococcus gallolyticus]|uniref:arsenate reductase (glutaredoxin) n=1 Tax=Streptococcus hepaticus TaxID=3349163 RepID=UPI001C960147|nr:arsenate reductase (glutaredoxin) [Streptococcus gallolyticus]MBY5041218.1 arsenate reductase (glutaredoxin) [Streptococcus gallolyticus]